MVYFKNICLILTIIFFKICNFSSSHIFKIFEAKCCQNVLREKKNAEREKGGGGGGRAEERKRKKKEKKKEGEMKNKKEERENIFV
jgi:hypothetical protein